MTQIVEGAKRALAGTPYQLVLAPAEGPEYDTIESLADGLVDGIIAVSPLVDPAWLENLARRVPIVMLGRHDHPDSYDTVVGDDAAGARAAMDHLLELGHRRIAHLTEPEEVTVPGSGTPHSIRLETYLACMAEAGLTDLVRGRPERTARGRGAPRHGGAARHGRTRRRRSSPPTTTSPSALLAGVADAGYGRGEVSVVGYDNTDLAAHPLIDLTSVDQQGEDMGEQAVRMLLERFQGRTEPRSYVATPTLQVRSSTGPPPAGSVCAARRRI